MNDNWAYAGKELETMAASDHYRRWIFDRLAPFLGQHIVEVGAGTGTFSELLLERKPQSLVALEPSSNMYPLLVKKLARFNSGSITQIKQNTLAGSGLPYPGMSAPDSIVYVNVLEHVEDDLAELRSAYATLSSKGRVLVFVPAHEWLMSPFDRRLGHFRRYTRESLIAKFEAAGFHILLSEYFDLLGIAPWWLKYRVFKSEQMERFAVRAYDRWGVPISRALDAMTNFRVGKNVIVIGEKIGENQSP